MSSLFRRPGDDSSSEGSSQADDEDTSSAHDDLGLLSRIHTVNSAGQPQSGTSRAAPISRNNNQIRDLLLHSLLEDKALTEAAKHLSKDRNDPEVQRAAQSIHLALCEQL